MKQRRHICSRQGAHLGFARAHAVPIVITPILRIHHISVKYYFHESAFKAYIILCFITSVLNAIRFSKVWDNVARETRG